MTDTVGNNQALAPNTDEILMKVTLIILTFLFHTSLAWSVDSFSIHRFLGSKGDSGSEVIQLVCVKSECLLTSSLNDSVLEKKKIKSDVAASILKSAEAAMKKSPDKEKSNIRFHFEKEGQHLESFKATADLILVEQKLKQSLRP